MKALRLAVVALAAVTVGCRPTWTQALSDDRPGVVHPAAATVPRVSDALFRPQIVRPTYAPPVVTRRLLTLPDGSRRLFPGHRVIAFYGAAGAPGLGVLGTGSPESVWPRLARAAKPYGTDKVRAVAAYELIAFVATGSRGNQGNFSSRVSDAVIARYARAAKRHHALLILDIQPGRGRFLPDARSLSRWLRLPYVGLGIDPEWKLYGGQQPLAAIGHTGAVAINRVSRWLDRLTRKGGLPQKLLVVHQFTDDMVRHKTAAVERRHVALVFNADGFGNRAAKLGKYHDFARDHRFPLGFKLFYDWDIGMLSPRDVLRMHPRPSVVEYE